MTDRIIKEIRTAIILSAGKSTRFGVPKFSVRHNDEKTFIEKIADSFIEYGCSEIIAVLNEDGAEVLKEMKLNLPEEMRIVINPHPEWARFFSLKLAAMSMPESMPAFVVNIDNPFVSSEVLKELQKYSGTFDYVYPCFHGKGGHPFMISAKVIGDIRNESSDQVHLRDFLGRYSYKAADVEDERVLANINTVEDLRKWLRH